MSRRRFLQQTSALGAALTFGVPGTALAEPPPETTKIRLLRAASICLSPQYVAEELLRREGFTEVEYPESPYTGGSALTDGHADLSMEYAPALVWKLDGGARVVALSGVHTGCYAIVASKQIKTIRDLKGKRVAASAPGSGDHVFLSSMLAYVGIDPKAEIEWVFTQSVVNNMPAFIDGKAEALLAVPPQPQKLRALGLGHVIVDGTHDRPWSQYICCIVAGSRDFVAKNPVATKRALRAILKATDLCAEQPEQVARMVVAKGFEPSYDIALEVLKDIPYKAWREISAEDAMRFHALRLHDAGMIKSTPEKIIREGTDWRFLNELKRELKA